MAQGRRLLTLQALSLLADLKAPTERLLSWRGLQEITMLVLLICTVVTLFIAYPTITTISSEERNKMIVLKLGLFLVVDSDADPVLGSGGTMNTSLVNYYYRVYMSTMAITHTHHYNHHNLQGPGSSLPSRPLQQAQVPL